MIILMFFAFIGLMIGLLILCLIYRKSKLIIAFLFISIILQMCLIQFIYEDLKIDFNFLIKTDYISPCYNIKDVDESKKCYELYLNEKIEQLDDKDKQISENIQIIKKLEEQNELMIKKFGNDNPILITIISAIITVVLPLIIKNIKRNIIKFKKKSKKRKKYYRR